MGLIYFRLDDDRYSLPQSMEIFHFTLTLTSCRSTLQSSAILHCGYTAYNSTKWPSLLHSTQPNDSQPMHEVIDIITSTEDKRHNSPSVYHRSLVPGRRTLSHKTYRGVCALRILRRGSARQMIKRRVFSPLSA